MKRTSVVVNTTELLLRKLMTAAKTMKRCCDALPRLPIAGDNCCSKFVSVCRRRALGTPTTTNMKDVRMRQDDSK